MPRNVLMTGLEQHYALTLAKRDFEEPFQFVSAATSSLCDPDVDRTPSEPLQDAYSTFYSLQEVGLDNCHFLLSDSPSALFQAAIDMGGLDAVVVDHNARPADLEESLQLLSPALTAKSYPGLWRFQAKTQHEDTRLAEQDPPSPQRNSSILKSIRRRSQKLSLPRNSMEQQLLSHQCSPPSHSAYLFADHMTNEPEDMQDGNVPARVSRFLSLSGQLSRTLSKPFTRSVSESSMSRSNTSTSLASSSSGSDNASLSDPYSYSCRVIIISDHPDHRLFATLDELSRPSSRAHLEILVKNYQARHGLSFDSYCLWSGNWDHLEKAESRPAYTRRAADGKADEIIDKNAISRIRPRYIKTYVVHSALATEMVPKLLSGEMDKDIYSREWFAADYHSKRGRHPHACFWPRSH